MDVILYVVPGLVMALAVRMACRVVRCWWRIRGAWDSGLTVEARCLGAYPAGRGGLHHVYEFIAHDGRVIRFEEDGGPATTTEGDYVMVRYTGGRRVVATTQAPSRARRAMTAVGLLAFLGVVALFCAGFLTAYGQASGPYGDLVSGVDRETSVAP
ncbi:hypothetical protein [Streptomyces dubilierae]|uniref:DUF3592 domain-containing protein n=1 Tax=Streptomyces dubilierae TaxID=3075533 RepID=A0ABU2PJB9_9ACTN|nr:hypothetical protein [Streptomyces sp. DSM 41921]MDT0392259.1 hypothetical protein [Streptomyces sp. DSM 41921]